MTNDDTGQLFDLDPYTDTNHVSVQSARRLLAQVEWLDEPDSDDPNLWWKAYNSTVADALRLNASNVARAVRNIANPQMLARYGPDTLGLEAVRAARDFLRSKEAER